MDSNKPLKVGDTCYIVKNGRTVSPASIVSISGGFYTLRFPDSNGMIRLKKHRIFSTQQDAEATIASATVKTHYNPYNHLH